MVPQEKMEVNGLHLYLKHLSFKIVFLTDFAGLNPYVEHLAPTG